MRKLTLACAILLILGNTLTAQTLFKFGGEPVDKDEFLRVYKKNAINQKPEYTKDALQEYLDLYTLFRMKVKEANLQHLDTLSSIQYELDNYRKQLAKNYFTDEEMTGRLLKEAYERMKENVRVAHILIMSSPMAPAKDTVEPYRKIDSIYNAITKKGADFGALAAKYSDDKQTRERGGEVGYITALQTIYDFENVAYNTPVGKVSKPFRTPYGYHVLKVLDKKPAVGDIKVAQILIAAPKAKGEEGEKAALAKVKEVEAQLKKGVAFEELVKKYSEDRFSNENGGELPIFGVGSMVPEFEKAAYALKKPGDISDPVKTDYGYHIIKLIQKYPIPTFDSIKDELKRRIERDSRSEVARNAFFNEVKVKNKFKEYPANLDELRQKFLATIADTGARAGMFSPEDFASMTKPVFEIKGTKYSQHDLMTYAEKTTRGRIMGPKEPIFNNIYDGYVRTVLNDVEEHNLMDEKPEFRNLMNEYRDGIMLFELMDRNVWSKASKDTTGLKEFYEKNKSHYMWKAGFRGGVYTFKNEEAMQKGVKLLSGKKKMSDEDLIKEMNTSKTPDAVTIQRGYFEFDKFDTFPQSTIKAGKVTDAKKKDDGYVVVYADEVFDKPTNKTLDEARGYVIAEYQDYLEKKWNSELKAKYPVKVNDDVFKSMIK